mgnify:CR=1 FL=1
MFDNIGEKIKGLAIFFTIIGIIGSIFGAIYAWRYDAGFFVGFIILIFGIIASWIGSFVLYGFGELIRKTSDIEEVVKRIQFLNVRQNSAQDNRYNEIINKVSKEIVDEYDEAECEALGIDIENRANEDECPYCFAKVNKNDTECPNCGNKLK